jgi:anti-anti-sigma factor
MTSDTTAPLANEYFQVKRHGDVAVIVPSPEVEQLPDSLVQPAADLVLAPLREDPPSHLIVDLEGVRYFGSAFITFLLRCHLLIKKRGSELVLAGVNPRIRELLRTTALDTLWALYESRQEALDALGGSD